MLSQATTNIRDHKNTTTVTSNVNTTIPLDTMSYNYCSALSMRAQACASICWRFTEIIPELFDTKL